MLLEFGGDKDNASVSIHSERNACGQTINVKACHYRTALVYNLFMTALPPPSTKQKHVRKAPTSISTLHAHAQSLCLQASGTDSLPQHFHLI